MSKTIGRATLLLATLAASVLSLAAQPAPPPPGGLSVSTNPAPAPAPATNAVGPKIKFANSIYDFGKVKSGEPVKYTYVFTNTGDELLEIKNVQPQCGCTAANDWTRKVEPGQTGTISIQFNSANYNGNVLKNVTVTCNDRTQPNTVLQLKGTLWKPIEVNPTYAVLNVGPDADSASTVVQVHNNTDEPLTLSDVQSNNRMFTVEVADMDTNHPGKHFTLKVKALPPFTPGNTSANHAQDLLHQSAGRQHQCHRHRSGSYCCVAAAYSTHPGPWPPP